MKTLAFLVLSIFVMCSVCHAQAKAAGGVGIVAAGGGVKATSKPEVAIGPAKTGGAVAQPKEKFYVCKVEDRAGLQTHQVLTQAELDTMEDEIKAESKVYARALMATERAWKADESTKKKTFPRSAISPRKVTAMQSFTDREKAQDKVSNYEEREALRLKNEQERERERQRSMGGGGHGQVDKKAQRELEKDSLEQQARQMFDSKLAELASQAKSAAQPADAKGAPAPAPAPVKAPAAK